jgi:diguanylate cyclase (GGDEF)-like protein/PAS domain S-box-containing protein
MTPLNLQASSLKKNLSNIFDLELLMKKGELTYKTLYINKSNEKIPVEINSKIISFNNKKMVLSTIRDITERKKAENKLKNQMKLTQTILDSLSSNIVVLDKNGIIKYTNQAWNDYIKQTDLNYQKNGLGMNYLEVFKKGDIRCLDKENAALEGIKEILKGRKSSFTLEYPCHYEGKKHWYKMKVTPFSGRENYSAVISNEEITAQKAKEKELNEQKRYLESIIKTTMDGFIMLNECGEILEINDAFQQMTGYTNQELMNEHISIFDTTRPRSMIELYLDKIKNNQSERFETKIMDKNDNIIYVEISATYLSHLEEPIYFAFVRDITEKIKKRKEIKYYSYHDQMTDLYNRRYFEIQMERLNKSDRYPIAIIIGDLDGLKLVNDTYGHQQGDSYIKNMAEILKSVIREEDILARFGGDEFAILLEKANLQIAKKICDRIKNKCKQLSRKENLEIPLKISLGYHVEDNKKKDLFVGLNKADQNMYNNKGRSLRMKNKEKQKN